MTNTEDIVPGLSSVGGCESSVGSRQWRVVLGPVTSGVSSGIRTISSRGSRESPEMVGIATFDDGPGRRRKVLYIRAGKFF